MFKAETLAVRTDLGLSEASHTEHKYSAITISTFYLNTDKQNAEYSEMYLLYWAIVFWDKWLTKQYNTKIA